MDRVSKRTDLAVLMTIWPEAALLLSCDSRVRSPQPLAGPVVVSLLSELSTLSIFVSIFFPLPFGVCLAVVVLQQWSHYIVIGLSSSCSSRADRSGRHKGAKPPSTFFSFLFSAKSSRAPEI